MAAQTRSVTKRKARALASAKQKPYYRQVLALAKGHKHAPHVIQGEYNRSLAASSLEMHERAQRRHIEQEGGESAWTDYAIQANKRHIRHNNRRLAVHRPPMIHAMIDLVTMLH